MKGEWIYSGWKVFFVKKVIGFMGDPVRACSGKCQLPSRCRFVDGVDYLGLDGGSEGVINRRGGMYNVLDWTTAIKGQRIVILGRVLLALAHVLL
jgi:hypothetical protein